MKQNDRDFVVALARGLQVLDCFDPVEPVLGNKAIAERTGLPRATVCRLTHTLTELGYLRRHVDSSQYELGSAVLSIGYPMLASMKIRQAAHPFMQTLANQVKGCVNAGIRDRTNIVYVETCRVSEELPRAPDIGSCAPIVQSSIGRAWLAAAPQQERHDILQRVRYETPELWKAYRRAVEESLREFPHRGFCTSFGDVDASTWAVAVPMRRRPGEQQIVFNCTAPAFRINKRYVENEMGPALRAMVSAVEESFVPVHAKALTDEQNT
ncbi:IclR family transcriptional regulator [Paraburkholderia nemoris]|uniref:IclR family transcriptional regulator n=1 Tax=Paraburkholderia nemoris TaxID=2793076 RepID=UPI0038BDDE77